MKAAVSRSMTSSRQAALQFNAGLEDHKLLNTSISYAPVSSTDNAVFKEGRESMSGMSL